MNWKKEILEKIEFDDIKNREEKEKVACKVAEKVKDGQVIGFGSGSTSYLAILRIAEKVQKENLHITAIPTSLEIKMLCGYLGIPTAILLEKKPDWSFDGADEVDENKWLIKGRGGAMFQEKLNIASSPITYILIDESKKVEKLGTNFPIPVECYPGAITHIKEELRKLGTNEIVLRKAVGKDGPVVTENGNLILDVRMENITAQTEKEIKAITGVIESGLFIGYPIEVLE